MNRIRLSLITLGLIGSSLSAAWIVNGVETNMEHPLQLSERSVENGGNLSAIDAYEDGVGVFMKGSPGSDATQIDNSAFNRLVFKYGPAAKANGISIFDQVLSGTNTPPATPQDIALANIIKGNTIASDFFADGTLCDDGDSATYGDKYIDNVCSGEVARSCKEILNIDNTFGNGTYMITPDTVVPFNVYCDMENGGWTKVGYTSDLAFINRWDDGDQRRYIPEDFTLEFSDEQIAAIRSVSAEAKQTYIGDCAGVLHYYYDGGDNYNSTFQFKFNDDTESNYGVADYDSGIIVTYDGCSQNSNDVEEKTIFEINNLSLPIKNVASSDSGNAGERFGSILTNNPAWFK